MDIRTNQFTDETILTLERKELYALYNFLSAGDINLCPPYVDEVISKIREAISEVLEE